MMDLFNNLRGNRFPDLVAAGCFALTLCASSNVAAFETIGAKWPQANQTVNIGLTGIRPDKNGNLTTDWDAAFAEAAQQWTDKTVFDYNVVFQYSDPCNSTDPTFGVIGVDFGGTGCGTAFNGADAVTVLELNAGVIIRADIIFTNNPNNYLVYAGDVPEILLVPGGGVILPPSDFRRVALHELGHALGLDHTLQSAVSIMTPTSSNREIVEQDDIDGVASLYANTGPVDDHSNSTNAATALTPANVPLNAVLGDASDLDYFSFSAGSGGRFLNLSTTGTTDTKGELYDANNNLLISKEDGGVDTNFSMSGVLPEGTYFIEVSSGSTGGSGAYTLNLALDLLCSTDSSISAEDTNCPGSSSGGGGGATAPLTLVLLFGFGFLRNKKNRQHRRRAQ